MLSIHFSFFKYNFLQEFKYLIDIRDEFMEIYKRAEFTQLKPNINCNLKNN